MKAPVLVFTYNRPEHTKELFDSLGRCKGIETHDLYVFSDGAKNADAESKVNAVREYLREISKTSAFKSVTVFEQEKNKGLANSIIDGVTKIINQCGTVSVLEDDLCVADDLLEYMQSCLEYYESDNRVGAISGFSHTLKCKKEDENKVYKSRTGNSWGWATWKNRWDRVDWEVIIIYLSQIIKAEQNLMPNRKEYQICWINRWKVKLIPGRYVGITFFLRTGYGLFTLIFPK